MPSLLVKGPITTAPGDVYVATSKPSPTTNPPHQGSIGVSKPSRPKPKSSLSIADNSFDDTVASLIPKPKAVTALTLENLRSQLESSCDAISSKILRVICREDVKGVRHEFLLVEAQEPQGKNLWIRLERAADQTQPRGWFSRSSNFAPSDTARIARTEEELTRDGISKVKTEIHFVETQVTLHALQVLLALFIQESTVYSLLDQNCWFFCSVVLEILSETFPHKLEGALAHGNLGKDVRQRIKHQFVANLTRSSTTASSSVPPNVPTPSPVVQTPASPQHILLGHRHQPFFEFTNHSRHAVISQGQIYPTSEHLFHSFKFSGQPGLPEYIATFSDDPMDVESEAKRHARFVRPDWAHVQISMMEKALRLKFSQHEDLARELLSTGDVELVDTSEDPFWGYGSDGNGGNEMGRALMRVRDAMRSNTG